MEVHHKIIRENDNLYPTSYSEEVEAVLAKLNLKCDSLDDPEFNVVSYINERFPNEQSLANLDEVIMETENKIRELDIETREILRGRSETENNGQGIVQEAISMIKTLFSRIQDVQDRATRSEEMVREITRDIQQLDQAKRNLTVSITALNNLILIVNALDQLNNLLGIETSVNGSDSSIVDGYNLEKNSNNPFSEDDMVSKNEKSIKSGKYEKITSSFIVQVSNLLAQVQRLIEPMLSAYGSVPCVASLSLELNKIHSVLAERLTREIKLLLGATRTLADNTNLIHNACELVDLLPENLQVKTNLINWFLSRHLAEYKELFEPTQTTAWLDKIDNRYSWLKTNLAPLERLLTTVFPTDWLVTERFVVEFCHLSRTDLETVMKRRQSELTHNLIIFALQRTLLFEATLNRTYSGDSLKEIKFSETLDQNKERSLNPFDEDELENEQETCLNDQKSEKSNKQEQSNETNQNWEKQPFDGIISSCFDRYFDLYLIHVEKALREQLTNRLIGDFTVNKSSFDNRDLGDVFKDDSFGDNVPSKMNSNDPGENTLNSATDLFLLFKQILKQTIQLNRGRGLLGLVRLLRQYLSEYTVRVLLVQIPGLTLGGASSGSNNSLSAPDVAAKMAAFGLSSLSALGISRGQVALDNLKSYNKANIIPDSNTASTNQFFATLLRDDGQAVRLNKDEVYKVCVILVTAAFCLKTVEDLEKRLKMEIRPPSWSSKISFLSELDGLAACRSVCVHRLVTDLEAAIEPHLLAMTKLPWNSLGQVGDQSVYVTAIVNHLRTQIPAIRETLCTVRPAFTQICIKFSDALITRFVNSLYRCKPVNTFGAEQLLLDTQSLKASLLQMPVFGAKFNQPPPRSFLNLVHEGMGRAERIIKAVMLPVGISTNQIGQESTNHSTSFVMGPVDNNSANVFLTSYEQLLPDSSQNDLQKVLDMKGVKTSEQQLILDNFHNRTQISANKNKESKSDKNSVYTEAIGSNSITEPTNVSRKGRLDKILPKRRQ